LKKGEGWIMEKYKVAVFVHEKQCGKKYEITAYLRDFNPSWPGYNDVTIHAENGPQAKRLAKIIVRQGLEKQHLSFNVAKYTPA
jgi:hypothetical protein